MEVPAGATKCGHCGSNIFQPKAFAIGCGGLIVLSLLFTMFCTGSKETASSPLPRRDLPPLPETAPAASSAAVRKFQDALKLSRTGWKDLGDGTGWYGSTQEKLAETGFVATTITYSIAGRSASKVEKALLSAFVASPRDLEPTRARLTILASQWFQSLANQPAPAALRDAILSGRSYRGMVPSASIEYLVERGTAPGVKQPDGTNYRVTTMNLSLRPQ